MRTSSLSRTLAVGIAFAIALVGLTGAGAEAVTSSGTLAGPSVAATYPSGSEWDDVNDRVVVADTGLDRIEFYTFSVAAGTYEKTGQFGRHGTAAGPVQGEFDSPRDVAIGPSGSIYVADAGNNRLQKFTSTGQFEWATPTAFGCAECLNTPIGVTWDAANGVVLVASTGQNLIKAYEPDGTLAWRSPAGSGNPVAGFAPRDVARGPDGRIWVSDYKHHMVKAFNVSAAGVWASTPAVTLGTGVAGNDLGQLSFPYNVDFSLDGDTAYVADTGNNRVARWDISDLGNPAPLAPIGGNCAGNPKPCADPPADLGTIDTLRRVNVDESGRLITADFWGNGLQVWSSAGAPVLQIELFRAPAPGFAQAFGVAVSDDGSTVIGVDRLNQRIEKFVDGAFVKEAGFRGVNLTSFSWPEAVAIDPTDGTVWVGDTRNDRIVQWKADLSGAIARFGGSTSQPAGPGEFTYVEDLDVSADGDVFVADTNNDRIQILPNGGSTFTVLGGEPLLKPKGVAVSINGTSVFVADAGNNRIVKLDASSGAQQSVFSTGLSDPQGVAVAADGTVWVADTGNHRILHLSTTLTNLGDTFGSRGTGPLEFEFPHTLDVAQDTLYVADTYNDRIRTFDVSPDVGGPTWPPTYDGPEISNPGGVAPLYPAGAVTASNGTRYVADSGGSRIVTIAPNGAQATLSGASGGWNDPRDIEFDSQNPAASVLWVMDTSNSRIVKLGTNGTIMDTLGGPSTFTTPYGLSNDATGIYVADTYAVPARVVKVSKTTGNVLWSATACSGTAFKRPRDVAVGPNGNVFVADTDNNRIVKLDPGSGACLDTFGSTGSGNGQFKAPRSLTRSGNTLWITEGVNTRLQHVTKAGAFLGKIGSFGTGANKFRSPNCVFIDGTRVDVCDTFNYRIQRFSVNAAGAPSYHSTVGGTPPAPGGFNGAFDVTYAPNGQMYAVDWFNHRIQKFSADGTFLMQWGGYGSADGSLIFPRGVVVTPDGSTVVVTDSENNRIDLFSPSGVLLGKVKPIGTAFNRPHQTALASDGTYWVADTNNDRILHLSAGGTVLANWNDGGAIQKPRGIAVDASGNVYVSNTGANRVEKYTPAGVKIANLTTFGTGPTQTKGPTGLRIAGSGADTVLLVADSTNDRVVVLELNGSAVTTFGSPGASDGQFDHPQGVAMDPETGAIAVADFSNNRISRWTT